MLINEAYEALYYKIATKEDLETAMTKGVNYPKGLIQWGEEIGLKNILKVLEELHTTYQEERYSPRLAFEKYNHLKKSIIFTHLYKNKNTNHEEF